MQGRSASRWRVIAHRRGGRDARLAWGGIREHDAFLGHELRGPAGTWRGGVSMAGGREGQGARKGNGERGHRLPSPPCFCSEFAYVFLLSVSMRNERGCCRTSNLCTYIHEFLYISHEFRFFILLSYLIFDFVCLTLSFADTHRIAKYARTYIQK